MADQATEQSFAEIRQLFRETDTLLREQIRATDARLDRRFQDSLQQIRALEALFTSQWGKFVEALVQPAVLRLFQEWGIAVHYVNRRVRSAYEGSNIEVDLILENDNDVIVQMRNDAKFRPHDFGVAASNAACPHHFLPIRTLPTCVP